MQPVCAHCQTPVSFGQWMTVKSNGIACSSCGYKNPFKSWFIVLWGVLGVALILFVLFLLYSYTQDMYSRGQIRLMVVAGIMALSVLWAASYTAKPLK